MTAKTVKLGKYLGHEINLNTSNCHFEVPDLDGRGFESMANVRAAVEALNKREAAASKVRLAVDVIDKDGNSYTITGVNSGNGLPLTSPRYPDNVAYAEFHPDVPWLREALKAARDHRIFSDQLLCAASAFKLAGGHLSEFVDPVVTAEAITMDAAGQAARAARTTLEAQLAKARAKYPNGRPIRF